MNGSSPEVGSRMESRVRTRPLARTAYTSTRDKVHGRM
jgi:hypothetical protein